MAQAVIVDAVRSPMGRGKATGALADVHPVDLLAQVLTALVTRNHLDPGSVDDVLVGCVGLSTLFCWVIEKPSLALSRRIRMGPAESPGETPAELPGQSRS